jgi:V-type H+-transporting ATPase subunit a
MSGLFRSEDMTYVRVIMADDAAYDTVRELGRFKKLHILDLAEAQQSAHPAGGAPAAAAADSSYTYYKKRVALCQFWERKLLSFKDAFTQYRIVLPDHLDPTAVTIEDIRSADVIEDCKTFIEPLEASFTKNVVFRKQHKQQINEFIEYLYVLKFNANNQFSNAFAGMEHSYPGGASSFGQLDEEKMESGGQRAAVGNKFTSTICGVIPQDKIIPFERLLFRVSRGNAFSHFFEIPQLIEDPSTGEKVKKQVFSVTFMGEQLSKRVSRIVQHAGATEYPLPSSPAEILALERDIQLKLNDSNTVLHRTDAEIRDQLATLAIDPSSRDSNPHVSPYLNWLTALQKERHICNVLKMCEQEGPHSKMITLEGWCPNEHIEELRLALAQAVRATQAKQAALQTFDYPPNQATPPTYFKTNAFTASFQGIVDTYGVPRYKEVNPGLFTIISFPFLFGIMYGDIGHGTILFLFSLYLLYNESNFLNQIRRGTMGEIPSMVFGGRYLLVMMGAFALYAGTIYNDCFSNPVHAFTSRWDTNTTSLDEYGGPYPYGVDPGWYHTTNELAFFNSMKMKLAVTLGVTQMTFGICLGAANDIYFKDYLAILSAATHSTASTERVWTRATDGVMFLSLRLQFRVHSSFDLHSVDLRLHGVHYHFEDVHSMGSGRHSATPHPDDDSDVPLTR